MIKAGTEISLNCSVRNQLKYAVYLPAIQPQFARAVVKTDYNQQLPNGLTISDLNYFNSSSKLFHLSAALYSAGNIGNLSDPPPCMVSTRQRGERQSTIVVGDSGGYQIAKGKLKVTPTTREEIYEWLVRYCDAAMTLDVPVWALDKGTLVDCNTFAECLNATIKHLDVFAALGAGRHRFLNVLHGRTLAEADAWYDAVKGYNFFGWALGSSTRCELNKNSTRGLCFVAMLWRIIALLHDNMFDRDSVWLHFLGVGDLKTALMLTTLKDTLNALLPCCAVEITYDTSSPSQSARVLSGMSAFSIAPTGVSRKMIKVNKALWADNVELLPFQLSTISQHVAMGDVIKQAVWGEYFVRELGYLILENNNVQATVIAIDAAHQLLESGLSRDQLNQLFPYHLLDAQDAIRKVLTQPTLAKAKSMLMNPVTQLQLSNAYTNVKRISH